MYIYIYICICETTNIYIYIYIYLDAWSDAEYQRTSVYTAADDDDDYGHCTILVQTILAKKGWIWFYKTMTNRT